MKTKGVTTTDFHGATCTMIIAPESKFKYLDKHANRLKLLETMDVDNHTLLVSTESIKSTVDGKGVVLGGLEWSDTPHDMFEVLKALDGCSNIIIQTGYDVDKFHEKIGRDCVDMLDADDGEIAKLTSDADDEMYRYFGHALISYYAGGTYVLDKVAHKKDDKVELYFFKGAEDERKN